MQGQLPNGARSQMYVYVRDYIYVPSLCVPAVNALVRLRRYTGFSEALLLAYNIRTKILCSTGPYCKFSCLLAQYSKLSLEHVMAK